MAKPSRKTATKSIAKPVNLETTKECNVEENVYIQFQNKEISHKKALDLIKDIWKAEGNDEEALSSIDAYVKPEEGTIYYVINGNVTGCVAF